MAQSAVLWGMLNQTPPLAMPGRYLNGGDRPESVPVEQSGRGPAAGVGTPASVVIAPDDEKQPQPTTATSCSWMSIPDGAYGTERVRPIARSARTAPASVHSVALRRQRSSVVDSSWIADTSLSAGP